MDSVLVGMEHGIKEKRESNMRGTIAGLLILGLIGSPLAAQVAPAPKPPAAPPVATQPNQPPKPEAIPPVKKAPERKFAGRLVPFTSSSPERTKEDLEGLDDELQRLEIQDISVKEFFERVKSLNLFSTLVIKDNVGEEMMPHTVVRARELSNFILQLGQFTDSIEVKMPNGDESIIVVSGKPKLAGKPNILFVPVNLEPLLAGINEPNEGAKIEKRMEKIKRIQIVIDQGVELDGSVRGLKPTVPLKMMVHPETNLLFLAGQTEQVEAASKILSALGAHIQLQDMMGGGWRTVPGGSGMGGPGMGMGFGGLGGGGMMPGMGGPGMGMPGMGGGFGPAPGGVRSAPNLPGASAGGEGGLPGAGGAPAPKPKPGPSVPPVSGALPVLPEPGPSVPPVGGALPVPPGPGASVPSGGGDLLPGGSGLPVGR
jgi:hypothetical protein